MSGGSGSGGGTLPEKLAVDDEDATSVSAELIESLNDEGAEEADEGGLELTSTL